MVFFVLNAIHISEVPGHYVNRKIQYSTSRTAVKMMDSYTKIIWEKYEEPETKRFR